VSWDEVELLVEFEEDVLVVVSGEMGKGM